MLNDCQWLIECSSSIPTKQGIHAHGELERFVRIISTPRRYVCKSVVKSPQAASLAGVSSIVGRYVSLRLRPDLPTLRLDGGVVRMSCSMRVAHEGQDEQYRKFPASATDNKEQGHLCTDRQWSAYEVSLRIS